jgi:16S rRNA G966 N2-methylase RsmD
MEETLEKLMPVDESFAGRTSCGRESLSRGVAESVTGTTPNSTAKIAIKHPAKIRRCLAARSKNTNKAAMPEKTQALKAAPIMHFAAGSRHQKMLDGIFTVEPARDRLFIPT